MTGTAKLKTLTRMQLVALNLCVDFLSRSTDVVVVSRVKGRRKFVLSKAVIADKLRFVDVPLSPEKTVLEVLLLSLETS